MATDKNLKQRARDGEELVALRPPITASREQIETWLARGKYDLIYIDGQHTPFSDDQLVAICRTAEELGLPVQFRIPHTRHAYLIGRYLDLGPSAILVPEVADPTVVEEAVAYAYYPPVGVRSWGGAARYGLRAHGDLGRVGYARWWNETVMLAIQLESIQAISNARDLIRPGVDCVAFGPQDLQFSLENNPDYPLRTVDDCMRHVAEQLQGSGIALATAIITVPEERQRYRDIGITLFQEAPID